MPALRDTSIATYRAKRRFAETPEPAPGRARRTAKSAIFVVQKHDASRLHWDFRLEHKGVLMSWAVPKGPSLDPADKRLAVHVEDHPVDYAGFEGTIPEGNYGAGTVEIWDRGTWAPANGDVDAAMTKGELKFTLAGDRLHGRFVLVRMKPRPREKAENWLLIKEHDEAEQAGADADAMEAHAPPLAPSRKPPRAMKRQGWSPPEGAERGALPETVAPMLASSADAPPAGGEWLSEIKFDGYRLLAFKDGDAVRLLTRTGLDWTHRFSAIARAVAALPAERLLLDGEAVSLRPDGTSSFADLQAALSAGRDRDLVLYAFDCLHRDGWDLRPCMLTDRKSAIPTMDGDTIRTSEHLEDATARVREKACAMGLEGIICKRADSPYRAGRSHNWLKLKCQGREEFLILGYTPPAGHRVGLGSLHLGYRSPDGELHYAGGVGTGFSDKLLRSLTRTLDGLRAEAPSGLLYADEPPPRDLVWVTPTLVAEVQFVGWTGAGRVRHAVFLGLREDKPAAEVVREVASPDLPRQTFGGPARHSGRIVRASKTQAKSAEIDGVRLTHPERELWPGITKADLAAYWRDVSSTALPGIAHRPLAFVRCPDGVGGQHFFQKHANRGMPSALREGSADDAPYLALDDAAGLVAAAQIAAIELHAWGSTEDDALRPDRLVFDLDPGDGVEWAAVIAAAHDLRDALEADGLASFPRTSGGKGLHLVVPLTPDANWDAARPWCRAFAERLERDKPDRYVASVPKARRHGRILIDWLRNGLGSTAVASFSPRARDGATVATPLAWREVTNKLDVRAHTLHTVPARLDKLKADPWEGFEAAARALPFEAAPPSRTRKATRSARSRKEA